MRDGDVRRLYNDALKLACDAEDLAVEVRRARESAKAPGELTAVRAQLLAEDLRALVYEVLDMQGRP